MKKRIAAIVLIAVLIVGCTDKKPEETNDTLSFEITNLTDEQYPDNPDIGFRSQQYQNDYFDKGALAISSDSFVLDFSFYTTTGDTIGLNAINVSELIPTIPERVKGDEYLSYISCINQEWNRNQVRFDKTEFAATNSEIIRVDLARNCLNAYLWEVIIYIGEGGKTVPYAHGWFDFPHELYAKLFEKKNNISFAAYKSALENWVDPESKQVNMDMLRTEVVDIDVTYKDKSDEMYPVAGARKKKFKEIIYPETFKTMRDLQTDSALFATFTPPGYYNKQDPRTTELGRIYNLKDVQMKKVNISGDTLHEIALHFTHRDDGKQTTLIIGGIDMSDFPVLDEKEANSGWKSSMGIGNHSFYEHYKEHIRTKSEQSPYYALLLDGEGKWLDSHKIGIDGPIFHFVDEGRKELHLWLLSFERHALVGHYVITLQ